MTATEVKRRRGTASQHALFTGAEGEITVDQTNNRLRVHDATTMGGHEIPNAKDLQKGSFNTANATGTNTLTLTLDPVPAYTTGMEINFKAQNNNSSTVTINVNSLGAKDLKKISGGAVVALIASDIVAGAYYTARYDGAQFILVGAGGGVNEVTGSEGIIVTPTTGAPNVSMNTDNAMGVGAYALMRYYGSSALASGATTAGTNVAPLAFTQSSVWGNWGYQIGSTQGGTWRNVSGVSLQNGSVNTGMFMRIA